MRFKVASIKEDSSCNQSLRLTIILAPYVRNVEVVDVAL